jgi:EAL domain-containing protein (putative c-di-GMP-specific phosphodiesterase class I)
MLLEMGCTIAQGFFFGKPMPPEMFDGDLWTPDYSPVVEPRLELQRAKP